MANFTQDQKGRLLSTVFPAYRAGQIGGLQVMEVTVDLSVIGSSAVLGAQSTLPNAGLGLAVADTFDAAVMPKNFQTLYVQFLLDTTVPIPDIVAPNASCTLNFGDSGSATRYASAQSIIAAGNALVYTTATQFYTAADTLRIAVQAATTPVNVKKGRLRIRIAGINYTAN